MRIFVKAKPNAKREQVEKIDATHFVVQVKEAPIQGRANRAIRDALAEYSNIAPSRIKLFSGFSSKQKTF